MIRLPVYLGDRVNNLHVAWADLTARTGRKPEASELAGLLGMKFEDIQRALAVPTEPTSRDAPMGTGD